MIAYIFYSHYDYSDIWPLMIGQSRKYLKNEKKYLITNKIGGHKLDGWEVILYDGGWPYQERVHRSIEKIKEEIAIFHHEDMFLRAAPNFNTINRLTNKVRDGQIDLIKLCKASYNTSPTIEFGDNLFINQKNLSFAIQPTIVKIKLLSKIYKATKGSSIWEFERNSNNYVNYMDLISCYYYEGTEKKRGAFHWDSKPYPYMATAVVKGKWDYMCYARELKKLLLEYDIDPNIRGKCE